MDTGVKRENWSSKAGFILAAAGSAIGLGNIWKFPYIAGENGGAAFILVYLICIAMIGLPVLMAEIIIGRTGQRNPFGSFKALTTSGYWPFIGGMGVIAGFIILSFYTVVAGWAGGYIYESLTGHFYNIGNEAQASSHFNSLVGNPYWIIGYDFLFVALTMLIVYFGVQKGIEKSSKILLPLLFIILIISMIRGLTLDGAEKGLDFLLMPDWGKISPNSILVALGHAFFTLSLGMGAMMTYGSYLSKEHDVPNSAIQIVTLDTIVALIAGIAIFTAVFATGQNPSSGPGLIFHTLPIVFHKMPGGYFFGIIFFFLLSIAALTSSISLFEVIISYFTEEYGINRHKAVIILGTVTFFISIPSALSFNIMSDFKIFGLTFFDLVDFLASNVLLPLGGMLIAIFVYWVWGADKAIKELLSGHKGILNNPYAVALWKFFIGYLSPALIFIVLLNSVGLLQPIIDWIF